MSGIELGHALITMVEPHRETVADYNRWYEHDHFLSGVLTGPGAFAGRRFLATRALKALRSPATSPVARPVDDGSFIAVYWIERDQLLAHCEWGFPEAARLAQLGRMNPNRRHVSTSYYDLVAATGRGARPVPAELALHHPYAALVMVWTATPDDAWLPEAHATLVDAASPIGQVVTLRPIRLPDPWPAMPGVVIDGEMPDGVLAHCCFVDRDVQGSWPEVAERVEKAFGLPGVETMLVAPFVPSVAGTDTHLDQLW
jgi:hypothetical protein